jgi:acyl dehydratase
MTATTPSVTIGDTAELQLVDDLTRTRLVQYAGASGDFNALHTDATYASQVAGFPGVFAHGMLTMGMTGRIVTDTWGIENLRSYSGRFLAQVWPGETLTARATVTDVAESPDGDRLATIEVETSNQDGNVVFTATATVTTA